MFVLPAREMAAIAHWRGSEEASRQYEQSATQMERTVLEHGWDGEWFLRAYDAFGGKVGSSECGEGQIFIEPQGMCILAGIGLENGFAEEALASVNKRLATTHASCSTNLRIRATICIWVRFRPTRPATRKTRGFSVTQTPGSLLPRPSLGTAAGRTTIMRASTLPRGSPSVTCIGEPYVYAQMIAGRDAPTHGEAKNSWLTGTAAWNYTAITQWILGIRPTLQGLSLSPVIPDEWAGFDATRLYRNARYHISVRRVGAGNAVRIRVEGQQIQGNILPLPRAGQADVEVEVSLGLSVGP